MSVSSRKQSMREPDNILRLQRLIQNAARLCKRFLLVVHTNLPWVAVAGTTTTYCRNARLFIYLILYTVYTSLQLEFIADVWIGQILGVTCAQFEIPFATFDLSSSFSPFGPMAYSGKSTIVWPNSVELKTETKQFVCFQYKWFAVE